MTNLLLISIGFIFGIINTISGGGSVVSLPALLFIGLEPHEANATNRVGGISQTLIATQQYFKNGLLNFDRRLATFGLYGIFGGIIGAFGTDFCSQEQMRWVITCSVVLISLITLFIPQSAYEDTALESKGSLWEHMGGVGIALYGGFIQSGVGILSLLYLRFICGETLLKATAVKVWFIAAFTLPALVTFIIKGQVQMNEGLSLALGGAAGAWVGAKLSLAPQGVQVIKKALPITALMMIASLIYKHSG